MEIFRAICERRSIRKFKPKAIAKDLIKKILEAGIDAPSAGNLHSRFFYVVENETMRRQLAAAAPDQDFIATAPVVLVVCRDSRIASTYGQRGVRLYAIQDSAAAIQNMLLAAYALGLGTCWVGAFDERKVTTILKLPENLRPVAIVPVGYSDEKSEPPAKPTLKRGSKSFS